jgi:hypothetical protein
VCVWVICQGLEGPAVSSLETGGGVVSSVGPDQGSLRMRNRLNHLDSLPDSRKRKDERALDKDEENYFNEDRCRLLEHTPHWKKPSVSRNPSGTT